MIPKDDRIGLDAMRSLDRLEELLFSQPSKRLRVEQAEEMLALLESVAYDCSMAADIAYGPMERRHDL